MLFASGENRHLAKMADDNSVMVAIKNKGKKQMKSRVVLYDNFRGLCILLVMIGHIMQWYSSMHPSDTLELVLTYIYSFHVPAFFIVSGMLFDNKKWTEQGWRAFVVTRIKSMLCPIAAFELTAALVKIALGTISIRRAVINVITLRFNMGTNWFLVVLFLSQLLFFAMRKWHNTMKNDLIILAGFASAFALLNGGVSKYLLRVILGEIFFVLGYSLKGVLLKKNVLYLLAAIALQCAAICVNGYSGMFGLTFKSTPLYIIGAAAGTYIFLFISRPTSFPTLSFLGKNSLAIMGTHYLAVECLEPVKMLLPEFMIIPAAAVCMAAVSLMFLKLFDRFPFLIGKF